MPPCPWIWEPDPVIFPIWGPLQIRWYGLCFLGVFYFCYKMLDWQMRRGGRGEDTANRFVNYGVVGLLLGAWFVHRFFYETDRVLENPFYLIDVRKGLAGLSSHGGALGLALALVVFGRRNKIPVGEMLDRMSFGGALSAVFVRLGNFFNSEILGRPADVPWAVCFPRVDNPLVPRHPTQLYEVAIGAFVVAALVWVDRRAGKEKRPRWLLFGVFMVLFFSLRFVVEFYKAHQALPDGSALTMGQMLSVPYVLIGIASIIYAFKTKLPAGASAAQSPQSGAKSPQPPPQPLPQKKRKGGKKRK